MRKLITVFFGIFFLLYSSLIASAQIKKENVASERGGDSPVLENHAQDATASAFTPSMSLQFHSDLRSRIAFQGQSRTSLYSNAVHFRSNLAPGLRLTYIGAQNNAPTLTAAGLHFDKFITQQATLEKEWGAQRLQIGVVRLPFGLYEMQEMYGSGLIDYPMTRVDFARDSVNWGVPGIKLQGGSPGLQGEVAVFGGQAAGVWGNQNNIRGSAFRLQTYHRDLIFALSRWDGTQSASFFVPGPLPTRMTGLDLRYTRPHLLLRGEYMFGTLGGQTTRGWYLDSYYRMPKYERITWVARLEEFKFGQGNPLVKQVTLGARYTLARNWNLALNWRRNNRANSTLSWTPPTGRGGELFFQVYQKVNF